MPTFYQNLPSIPQNSTKNLWLDKEAYSDFNEEWYVVSFDIKGSTKAIEKGEYKKVNMLASSCIVAFLNISIHEIPFVFGGDGATILIPHTLKDEAEKIILMCKRVAHQRFGLVLRGDILSVKKIYQAQKEIKVLKEIVDERYTQAIFRGGGLSYAEELLKTTPQKDVDLNGDIKINMDGLECRWQDIRNPLGLSVSILIKAKDDAIYEKIFNEIEDCFGKRAYRNPIQEEMMKLSFSFKTFLGEAKAKNSNYSAILMKALSNLSENILGYIFMKLKLIVGNMPWGEYKSIVKKTTDNEKFEDMLQMVVASNKSSIDKFSLYLEKAYQAKELNYGLHISQTSLMTCLVFERHGKQVHFVDSNEGGYAMASKGMKAQVKI